MVLPWLQFAQKTLLIACLLQVKHVSLFIFHWLNNVKAIKWDNVGETITQDAHCMSNMGRRPNKCQLPASPFITIFQLKPCTTGVRATHWKSSAGALVSEGNPCPGACRKAEERGCGQRAAVSAGATDLPPGSWAWFCGFSQPLWPYIQAQRDGSSPGPRWVPCVSC